MTIPQKNKFKKFFFRFLKEHGLNKIFFLDNKLVRGEQDKAIE